MTLKFSKSNQLQKRQPSYKTLRKKAWDTFSLWVRKRDKGVCFTCGVRKHWKKMHAGHFIHRDCLDFNEKAINCQCVRCNMHLHGNLAIYAYNLAQKYGPAVIDELVLLSKKSRKFTRQELEDIIEKYKEV